MLETTMPPCAMPRTAARTSAQYELAPRSYRAVATLVDYALIAGPAYIATSCGAPKVVLGWTMVFALVMAVAQWTLLAAEGQSFGKKLMGIRIERMGGGPVDFHSAVLMRIWVPVLLVNVPTVGAFFATANVLMVLSESRRCLHDYLADTEVVMASEVRHR